MDKRKLHRCWLFPVYEPLSPYLKDYEPLKPLPTVEVTHDGNYFEFVFEGKSFKLRDKALIQKLSELYWEDYD